MLICKIAVGRKKSIRTTEIPTLFRHQFCIVVHRSANALHEIAGVTGPTAPGDVPTAAPPAAVQDPAAEVTWTLRSLSMTAEREIDLPGDAEFTLLLRDDGTLSARADCNNCFGDYSMTDDSITIERIGSQ